VTFCQDGLDESRAVRHKQWNTEIVLSPTIKWQEQLEGHKENTHAYVNGRVILQVVVVAIDCTQTIRSPYHGKVAPDGIGTWAGIQGV